MCVQMRWLGCAVTCARQAAAGGHPQTLVVGPACRAARKEGYYRYASEHQMVVGAKDRWTNNTSVTFFEDEPARHKVVDVLGSLSMLATMGGSGLPKGHVITWKSDHVLEVRLLDSQEAVLREGWHKLLWLLPWCREVRRAYLGFGGVRCLRRERHRFHLRRLSW